MPSFYRGSTIYCTRNVKDLDGNYFDPSTSMKITIDHALNGIEVNGVDMEKDSTGKYHYYYTLPSVTGVHKTMIRYEAKDGSNIAVWEEEITVR